MIFSCLSTAARGGRGRWGYEGGGGGGGTVVQQNLIRKCKRIDTSITMYAVCSVCAAQQSGTCDLGLCSVQRGMILSDLR